MKKTLFAAFAALFLLASCNDKPPVVESNRNSKAYKNQEASRAIIKAFQTGDVSEIDSVVSANLVDHTDRGDMGRDSLKAMMKMTHASNKDMKMEVIKELADDDYVFTWARYSGTSDGKMMPAGPYNMTAIEATKFVDGKAVEHWEFMEPREMMKMMPAPPPPAKK